MPDWIANDPLALPAIKASCVLVCYALAMLTAQFVAIRLGRNHGHEADRIKRALHAVRILLRTLFTVVLLIVLGVDLAGIPAYLGSFLAVVGMALFARWSILSNITSGLIIFAAKDLKVGDRVRILDEKEPIEGAVTDFRLWSLVLRRDDGHYVYVPNSLMIQRPTVLLDRAHLGRTTQLLQ